MPLPQTSSHLTTPGTPHPRDAGFHARLCFGRSSYSGDPSSFDIIRLGHQGHPSLRKCPYHGTTRTSTGLFRRVDPDAMAPFGLVFRKSNPGRLMRGRRRLAIQSEEGEEEEEEKERMNGKRRYSIPSLRVAGRGPKSEPRILAVLLLLYLFRNPSRDAIKFLARLSCCESCRR